MNVRKLNVGLVGLGGVAQEHLKACAHSDLVTLRCGADINPDRCKSAENDYGITAYSDYADMMQRETLDIICVLTPPAAHLPVIKDAAETGHHILCEKPLAPSMEDARAIADIVDKSGVHFQFGLSYRHLPAMQRARDIILNGDLGDIRLCYECAIGGLGLKAAKALPESHYPSGGPGGTAMGLVDHGIHMIDAFPWLTGHEPVSVWGRGNITGRPIASEYAAMELSNGALTHLIYDEGTFGLSLPGEGAFVEGAGWNVNGYVEPGGFDPYPTVLTVHGAAGAMRIYPYANRLYVETYTGLREITLPPFPAPNHFRAQIDSLARLIRDDGPVSATIEDGLQTTNILLQIYQSAACKREIALCDNRTS